MWNIARSWDLHKATLYTCTLFSEYFCSYFFSLNVLQLLQQDHVGVGNRSFCRSVVWRVEVFPFGCHNVAV